MPSTRSTRSSVTFPPGPEVPAHPFVGPSREIPSFTRNSDESGSDSEENVSMDGQVIQQLESDQDGYVKLEQDMDSNELILPDGDGAAPSPDEIRDFYTNSKPPGTPIQPNPYVPVVSEGGQLKVNACIRNIKMWKANVNSVLNHKRWKLA